MEGFSYSEAPPERHSRLVQVLWSVVEGGCAVALKPLRDGGAVQVHNHGHAGLGGESGKHSGMEGRTRIRGSRSCMCIVHVQCMQLQQGAMDAHQERNKCGGRDVACCVMEAAEEWCDGAFSPESCSVLSW